MRLEKISFEETKNFSSIFLNYLSGHETLRPYFNRPPSIDSFEDQIKEKNFSAQNRQTLVEELKRQYEGLEVTDAVTNNLDLLLEENTYTITTGHQLNIFTGPLYFVYKIVTVINICKRLSEKYPSQNFVPVYWMASEDHDFDEINHFNLYGKQYKWDTDQSGAVGRFDPNSLKSILDEIPGHKEVFEEAYLNNDKLADAVRSYVNALFGEEGLIVIDADCNALKSGFKDVIEDDLVNHTANQLVENCRSEFEALKYNAQIFPREINFFCLEENYRDRIVQKDGNYEVLNQDTRFSKDEILDLVSSSPEKFSPNVILRPLYQETILPNLAYIGGPAEIAYWLLLKPVFDHYETPFPILMPRNFALVMNRPTYRKYAKADIAISDIFLDKHELLRKYVIEHSEANLNLNSEKEALATLFNNIKSQVEKVDPTLGSSVEAEGKRAINGLEKVEGKLLKAEKRNNENQLNRLAALKDVLFPGQSLQERHDNLLNFYQENPSFISQLLELFDPFDFRFHILLQDEQTVS
ncbi:MAG: bacillithiol biosynthesis cysteine-adding enzyme BshC [Bacteroidota bacterium]